MTNQLKGIIFSGGAFKPLCRARLTAIVAFRKGGETEDVFFYDKRARADRLSLDRQ
jgi:predicted metal-dependent enzyme (double-stranded beta helix superfamily)